MKSMLLTIATGLLAFAFTASGQNTPAQTAQPQGKARGGAPHAYGDKNKDGMCDVTGKPVGQGRAQTGGRRMGRGQGRMRGNCNCCARNQAAAASEAKK